MEKKTHFIFFFQPPSSSTIHSHLRPSLLFPQRTDTHLNNHKNKCVSNSLVRTTNKQNVHIIEHNPLCTMSLIKTRIFFINLSPDTIHQEGIARAVNCKQQEKTGVFIPFRHNKPSLTPLCFYLIACVFLLKYAFHIELLNRTSYHGHHSQSWKLKINSKCFPRLQ